MVQGTPPGIAPQLAVVLCHGFGAPGNDLVGLADELCRSFPRLASAVRFVFPQAPLSLQAQGMGDGRAWWHLDPRIFDAQQRGDTETLQALRSEVPRGLPEARKKLHSVVEAVCAQTGLPLSKLVLGGFSQGAMIAADLALRLEEAPGALALFSGTLICEAEWSRRAALRKGLKVLQTHGTADPVLGFEPARALEAMLRDAGLEVEFLPFPGGHTIPAAGLARFGALLEGLLRP